MKTQNSEIQVGQRVHIGFGAKGGAGYVGTVKEITDHPIYKKMAEVELDAETSTGKRTVKGPVDFVTPEDAEPVAEKAVSQAQQQAAGAALAAKRGDAPHSELKGASKEMSKMDTKELEKYAGTKHKDLPKKVEEKDEEDSVEETTSAGSVATSVGGDKGSKNSMYGKGVYEEFETAFSDKLTESKNISINISDDQSNPNGKQVSVTVSASGEDADALSDMLKLTGLTAHSAAEPADNSYDLYNPLPSCGAMEEQVEETEYANSPDEKEQSVCYMNKSIAGGLNRPKRQINPENPGDNPLAMPNLNRRSINVNDKEKEVRKRVAEVADRLEKQLASFEHVKEDESKLDEYFYFDFDDVPDKKDRGPRDHGTDELARRAKLGKHPMAMYGKELVDIRKGKRRGFDGRYMRITPEPDAYKIKGPKGRLPEADCKGNKKEAVSEKTSKTKYAIKTPDGKYLKLTPQDYATNMESVARNGIVRIGPRIQSKPYKYSNQESARAALAMINVHLDQNNVTPEERASLPPDSWYYKYIDRQIGSEIEEITEDNASVTNEYFYFDADDFPKKKDRGPRDYGTDELARRQRVLGKDSLAKGGKGAAEYKQKDRYGDMYKIKGPKGRLPESERRSKKALEEGLGDLADHAEKDHEVQMARSELYKIGKYAIRLHEMLKGISEMQGLKGWQQSKITKAADYISSVYHSLDYELHGDSVAPGMDPALAVADPTMTIFSEEDQGQDIDYNDYTVHYTTADGTANKISVSTGGTYDTIDDFVKEFLSDHPGYTVKQIKKATNVNESIESFKKLAGI